MGKSKVSNYYCPLSGENCEHAPDCKNKNFEQFKTCFGDQKYSSGVIGVSISVLVVTFILACICCINTAMYIVGSPNRELTILIACWIALVLALIFDIKPVKLLINYKNRPWKEE